MSAGTITTLDHCVSSLATGCTLIEFVISFSGIEHWHGWESFASGSLCCIRKVMCPHFRNFKTFGMTESERIFLPHPALLVLCQCCKPP